MNKLSASKIVHSKYCAQNIGCTHVQCASNHNILSLNRVNVLITNMEAMLNG